MRQIEVSTKSTTKRCTQEGVGSAPVDARLARLGRPRGWPSGYFAKTEFNIDSSGRLSGAPPHGSEPGGRRASISSDGPMGFVDTGAVKEGRLWSAKFRKFETLVLC